MCSSYPLTECFRYEVSYVNCYIGIVLSIMLKMIIFILTTYHAGFDWVTKAHRTSTLLISTCFFVMSTVTPRLNLGYWSQQDGPKRAVVVVQLADQTLLTPEVCGSNPFIGEFLGTFINCQLYWKDENIEKEAGNGPFLEKRLPKIS